MKGFELNSEKIKVYFSEFNDIENICHEDVLDKNKDDGESNE